MVVATDSTGNRGSSRNDLCLFKGGRRGTAATSWPPVAGKTGQSVRGGGPRLPVGKTAGRKGNHRPPAGKTGQWDPGGDRQNRGQAGAATRLQPVGQRLRSLSRRHRGGSIPRPQRQGDLAGSGGRLRLLWRLSERQAFRPQAPWKAVPGSLCRD